MIGEGRGRAQSAMDHTRESTRRSRSGGGPGNTGSRAFCNLLFGHGVHNARSVLEGV